MLAILRLLRTADKPRWHHRIAMRVSSRFCLRCIQANANKAAQIIYDSGDISAETSQRAKDYLIDQHIYSPKTSSMTIWKPDAERIGRRWCYAKQYALFLGQLLDHTTDLEGIATFTRRVRKKTNEYYEHTMLWEELCKLHLKVSLLTD